MSKKGAYIILRLNCKYDNVEYNCQEGKEKIKKGQETHIRTDGRTFDLEIRVFDGKNRQIKYVKFFTNCADHWDVHDDGVVLVGLGKESDVCKPRQRKKRIGETHKWTEDKEESFAKQDKEEEAKKAAAKAAQEKATKEAAQKAAEEKTKKEAAQKAAKAAEEKAKKETAQKAAKAAEEQAKKEAAQKEAKAAEEKAKKEAAQKAAKAAEEKAKKEAEVKKQQEIVSSNKAEEERQTKKEEIRIQRDIARRDATEMILAKNNAQKWNSELNSQQSVNWTKDRGNIASKLEEAKEIEDICNDITSDKPTEHIEALKKGFDKVKEHPEYASIVIAAIEDSLKLKLDFENENLIATLIENIQYMSKSLFDDILDKLTGCPIDMVKSNPKIFSLIVAVFQQECTKTSIWNQITNSADSEIDPKCLNCFEKYAQLCTQAKQCKKPNAAMPEEMIESLMFIYDEQNSFPENCISLNLVAFANACKVNKIFPARSFDLLAKLSKDDIWFPIGIHDLIAENISTDAVNEVQQEVVKYCLENGKLSQGMLKYLTKVCNKEVQSTITEYELLQCIGEFVENCGHIPDTFLNFVVEMFTNNKVSNSDDFQYCISILDYFFTRLSMSSLEEKIKEKVMFLKFLTNAKSDANMKVDLLKFMIITLTNGKLRLTNEILKYVVGIVSEKKELEEFYQAAYVFIQVAIYKELELFQWYTIPEQVIIDQNELLTKMHIILLAERLQSKAIPFELSTTMLLPILEVIKNEKFKDNNITAACLAILGIELNKEKSREVLQPIVTLEFLQKFITFEDIAIKEEAVFVIAELAITYKEHRIGCLHLLEPVLFNWPTVQAHTYASKAITKIILELSEQEAKDTLGEFMQCDGKELLCFTPEQDKNMCEVLQAWIGHLQSEIPTDVLEKLCSILPFNIVQHLLGIALNANMRACDQLIQNVLQNAKDASSFQLSTETLASIKQFISQPKNDLEKKISLAEILLVISKQRVHPCKEFLEVLDVLSSTKDNKLTEMFVEASSHCVAKIKLMQSMQANLWNIIADEGFAISTRRTAAKTISLAILQDHGELGAAYLPLIIRLLDTPDLHVLTMFILCCASWNQLSPISKEVLVKIAPLQEFKSTDTTVETTLCSRLAILVSEKLEHNEDMLLTLEFTSGNPNCKDQNINWVLEWIAKYPEDEKLVIQLLNSIANQLIKTNIQDATSKAGNMLKLQSFITRARHATNKRHYSDCISWLDKAKKYVMKHEINKFDKEITFQFASVYQRSGSHNAAVKCFKNVLKNTEDQSNGHLKIAIWKSLLAYGSYEAALKELTSLPSTKEQEFHWERLLCEKVSVLSKFISEKTGVKSIAKAQIKFLLTKQIDLTAEAQCKFIDFLIERGEHYNLSVLTTRPQEEWEIEFLKSEINSRLKDKRNESTGLTSAFNKLKTFIKTASIESGDWKIRLQDILMTIVSCQKSGYLLSAEKCADVLLLLRITTDCGKNTLINGKSDEEIISSLQVEWLRELVNKDKQISDDNITEFWTAIKQGPLENKSTTFLEQIIEELLKSNTFCDIVAFLKFCKNEKVKEEEITTLFSHSVLGIGEKLNLEAWKKTYMRKRIAARVQEVMENFEKLETLQFYILSLFDQNVKTYEDIMLLLEGFSKDKQSSIAPALLETLYMYMTYRLQRPTEAEAVTATDAVTATETNKNSKASDEAINIIWTSKEPSEWISKMKDACLNAYAAGQSNELSVDELIEEFTKSNEINNSQEIQANIKKLKDLVTQVKSFEDKCSLLEGTTGKPKKAIKEWTPEDIKEWADIVRKIPADDSESSIVEMLAVLQQAMHHFVDYNLRDVGLMSILMLLSSKDKGCLAKIATGEGKSSIVATLAAIKCLQGHTVDIVTSSPVLAARDAKDWEKFYESLGFTSMDNSGQQITPNSPKDCYTKDVVYGDASTFQGDILREEFSLLNTRGKRKNDVVIVDEVDSMFIDGSNHSTRLIESMPEMEYFENVFANIWYEVQHSVCLTIDEVKYLIDEPCGGETKERLFTAIDKVLPEMYKRLYDGPTLNSSLEKFAAGMEQQELKSDKYRKYIENILQNKKFHAFLDDDLKEKLNSMSPNESRTSVIDDYIKNKWKLNKESNARRILDTFLNITILIYDLEADNIQLSLTFHNELMDSIAGRKNTKILFGITGETLYLLKPVVELHQSIAERTKTNVMKMVTKECKMTNVKEHSMPDISETGILIPSHLFELFNAKIDEWIQSALQARFLLEENRDYIVKETPMIGEKRYKTIVPVDYLNTGVTEESCVWGDGLHQFLQLKHKFRLTPEYLATNFLSNLTFFRRYNTNILGLTGTLGDQNERQLLEELYKVSTVNVPSFKKKRLFELSPIVSDGNDEWLSNILYSTALEVENKRAVLIICKTIDDVEDIHNYLKGNIKQACQFQTYCRSDSEKVEEGDLAPGSVIIATNLAGRGTNIKLCEDVVNNGGLHVIISFLPTNVRVEEQAAGRAARSGEPGTFVLILNAMTDIQSYKDESSLQITNLKKVRDTNELQRVESIKNELVKQIEIEEEQFRKFCKFREEQQKKGVTSKHIQSGLAERWAVQLETVKTNGKINWEKMSGDFKDFFKNLEEIQGKDEAVKNPAYYILEGNKLNLEKNYSDAIKMFEKAIMLDSYFVQYAYYNKAYAMINNGDNKNNAALEPLNAAYYIIGSVIIPSLMQLHAMAEAETLEKVNSTDPYLKSNNGDSDLTKQIIGKINFHYLHLNSIEEAMKKIKDIGSSNVIAVYDATVDGYYDKTDLELNNDDLTEMYNGGFISFMTVQKKPVPKWKFFVVFLLGAIQAIAGIALTCCGFPNVGAGLICEGVNDIITGAKAVKSGELDLKEYFRNKGINMAIGVLCAGAGAAFAAVSKIGLVQRSITTVRKIGSKLVSGAKGLTEKVLKSSFGKVCKSTYDFVDNKIATGIDHIQNSRIMKHLDDFRESVLNDMKSIETKSVEDLKKITKFDRLSPKQQDVFKSVGKAIVKSAMDEGILPSVEDNILQKIIDKINEKLKATVSKTLSEKLSPSTDVYKKFSKVLTSSNGKTYNDEIDADMDAFITGDTSNGGLDWNTFVNLIGSKVKEELDALIDSSDQLGIVKFIEDTAVTAICSAKTITELTELTSKVVSHLETILDEKIQEITTNSKQEDTNGSKNFVNAKDADIIIDDYIDVWSDEISSQISQFVTNDIIAPTAKDSFHKVQSKITQSSAKIEQKLPGKDRTSTDELVDLGFDEDAIKIAKDLKEPVTELVNLVKEAKKNNEETDSSTNMQMTALSSILGKSIEVFQETPTGELNYHGSFEQVKSTTSQTEPIRLLLQQTEAGNHKFLPMIKNEDEMLELLDLNDLPDEASLTASALIASSDGKSKISGDSILELYKNMVNVMNKDAPRYLHSFKDQCQNMDRNTKDIIFCNSYLANKSGQGLEF